jgi:hypothetical protein
MPDKSGNTTAMVITGVVILLAVAAVALLSNFAEISFGSTWPVLLMAVSLGLLAFRFWELGFGLFGFFCIWLLSNLGVIPAFSKSWPFALIWIALLVVIGFLRARSQKGRTARGG